MSESDHSLKKLGWFLCWAVVFADIGTSLYYVPGILFGQVGNLAGLFVSLTSIVFVLLAIKYIEITDRYPEGGGVVTVATNAFGPWFGALGGMFITVDYFLTASISSVSGFAYLNSIVNIAAWIPILAVIGVIALGILNIIGIKESAGVTAVIAVAAFVVDIILVAFVVTQLRPEGWGLVLSSFTKVSTLTPWSLMTGFAGSFLAFSGLESISQLSPAMQAPRKKIATIAMVAVIITIVLTSPFLTAFSTNLLNAPTKYHETMLQEISKIEERTKELTKTSNSEQIKLLKAEIQAGQQYSDGFISELGAQFGGSLMRIAVVLTASVLLLFASNTAIIGAYHVFMALSRQNFLPKFLQHHNAKFGTPHYSVFVAVTAPVLIILATWGNVNLLGELYAFGLLGAFALSSIGLDLVRWRENRKVTLTLLLGIITSVLVVIAWGTNLYAKQLATIFGGTITLLGMIIAYVNYRYFSAPEFLGEIKLTPTHRIKKDQVLLPLFGEYDKGLIDFVADYIKGAEKTVVLLFIREFHDVLQTVAENIKLDEEAENILAKAQAELAKHGVPNVKLLYAATNDTGEEINEYREKIKPEVTILSPHKQSSFISFVNGDVMKEVMRGKAGNILIHTAGMSPNVRRKK